MATAATNNSKDRRRAASHMQKTLHSLRDDVNSLGHDMAEFAGALQHDASDQAGVLAQRAQRAAQQAVASLQEQVRERPGVAIGIAAGAGIILGLLLANRR
jgi:ElaB/YqjD/DUF883 family membrane-anchored ribosome-binding protein